MPKSQRPENKKRLKDTDTSALICTCNKVSKDTIEGVISRGCKTLPKISTATTAGVGQCGGSCQPTIQFMLDEYLKNGKFPENPLQVKLKK